jgi:flagellar biosynthesis chaperone FliJ
VKETADEWIQRVTSIMSQLTEQNQKSVEEFEICLQEIRTELHQTKEEIKRVVEERDAARNDIAVLQVGTTYLLLSNFCQISLRNWSTLSSSARY